MIRKQISWPTVGVLLVLLAGLSLALMTPSTKLQVKASQDLIEHGQAATTRDIDLIYAGASREAWNERAVWATTISHHSLTDLWRLALDTPIFDR